MVSSLVSLGYIGAIMVALLVYARRFNSQKTRALGQTLQFYENHFARDIYTSVKEAPSKNKKIETAALIAFTAEDVVRSFKMNDAKNSLNNLNQNGFVGDEMFKRFTGTEQLLRAEVQDIARTAGQENAEFSQLLLGASQTVAQSIALNKRLEQLDLFKKEYESFA